MDYNDILALAKAGFNSQQIALLAEQAPEPKPVEKTPEPKPVQEKKEEPVNNDDTKNGIDNIMKEVQSLHKIIQNNNIVNSNQPPKDNVDDILASIINPTYQHKEN